MALVRCGHTFTNRDLPYSARSNVPHLPEKKSIPAGGNTSAKQLIFRPIPSKGRHTKQWTAIAWPTNIQSKTPDGKFGPAKQMEGWQDCWFLASLAAVVHDQEGHKILAERIKKADGGYDVTFKGSPNHNVFISDAELQELLGTAGGDADTRLMELAADKFFNESGNFKSLYIAALIKMGMNQDQVEQCLQDTCNSEGIQDPMIYNPISDGGYAFLACFMLTGMYPDILDTTSSTTLQRGDVMRFLNKYVTNHRDGALVILTGLENPLGDEGDSRNLLIDWDAIRTEITRDERLRKQQRGFLNTLSKWLETRDLNHLEALKHAAGKLKLEHCNPVKFVNTLANNQLNMNQYHFNLLRSAVQEVLAGGPGYIGFPGSHDGTIEGINMAANTFTYSEPNYPTLVHTGELSGLIQAISSGNVYLNALKPITGQDEGESSHAGEKRGRHLIQIHNQAVRDGKIDPAESGSLANLMEMDDGAFRQIYDSDKNGVIEGGELKAVKLRVDRWADHFKLTPIW